MISASDLVRREWHNKNKATEKNTKLVDTLPHSDRGQTARDSCFLRGLSLYVPTLQSRAMIGLEVAVVVGGEL